MPLTGFFELRLNSSGIPFLVTAEIESPGLTEEEAKARIIAEWVLHFAISAPINQDNVQCESMRPLSAKPSDALRVPKGTSPVLIWKSEEA
jgi:hypothetical protein